MFSLIKIDVLGRKRITYSICDNFLDSPNSSAPAFASFLVNDLNIEFDDAGGATSIWGYFPRAAWKDGVFIVPSNFPGRLVTSESLAQGVSRRITPAESFWPILFDSRTGWIQVAPNESIPVDCAVQFVSGCVVGLSGGKISGLWLKPEFV